MPPPSKRQVLGRKFGSLHAGGNENEAPDPLSITVDAVPKPPKPPSRSLKTQIMEKDIRIGQLETRISALETELSHLRDTHHEAIKCLSRDNCSILDRNQLLCATNKSLASRKRKAERELSEEITKKHKRIKRLERDREANAEASNVSLEGIQHRLDATFDEIKQLKRDLAQANNHILSRDLLISSLQSSLREKQSDRNSRTIPQWRKINVMSDKNSQWGNYALRERLVVRSVVQK
ncbi:hypothetical protein B0H13DRAFT_2264173 [Mycena leptocephala]|nr:hypothetical protein B0H13DRAFT_2264173 [Mycena leptocephala]